MCLLLYFAAWDQLDRGNFKAYLKAKWIEYVKEHINGVIWILPLKFLP